MLWNNVNIRVDKLENKLFEQQQVNVTIARLDLVHPVVSGNKLFKLHYFLEAAMQSAHQCILSFGGAYSNHLVATAYACKKAGLKCIGIVRGEQISPLSHTLQSCLELGMQLSFISRAEYAQKDMPAFSENLTKIYGEHLLVPEGGYHPMGAKGAAMIMDMLPADTSHICCAVGTATTLAGLLLASRKGQSVIAIPVLKGMKDIEDRTRSLSGEQPFAGELDIVSGYHFGGYAKSTPDLIAFMNDCYRQYQLPTDFVYTAKMLYGVFDMIAKGNLPSGSNITCLHTGGLQGNCSLPTGALIF